MSLLKSAAALAFVAALAVGACAAQSFTGLWKGKIVLHFDKLPGSNNPLSHQALVKQQARLLESTVRLTLSPNHHFVMTVAGAAAASMNKTTKGTWSQKGDQLVLLADQKGVHPNPFTIAKDGKSFTVSIAGGGASLTFTR